MNILEAVQRGGMLFLFVFIVLAVLYALIILFSKMVKLLDKAAKGKQEAATPQAPPAAAAVAAPAVPQTAGGVYGGQLRLRNVDDQTAAIIMAIVSDQSGIPLSELVFKSISLVGPKQNAEEEA